MLNEGESGKDDGNDGDGDGVRRFLLGIEEARNALLARRERCVCVMLCVRMWQQRGI